MPLMSMPPQGLGISQSPARNLHLEDLLAKLSEQQVLLNKQNSTLQAQRRGDGSPRSSGSSDALTNPYATTPRTESQFNDIPSAELAEMMRLKKELETAQTQIARMDQELSQTRITKHTLEQAMGSQFDSDFDHIRDLRPQNVASRVDTWVQSTEPGVPPINVNPPHANNNAMAPAPRGIWGPGSAFIPANPGVIGQAPANNNWPLTDPRAMAGARLETNNANMFPVGPSPRGCPPGLRIDTSAMGPYMSEPSSAELNMRGGHSRPPSAFGTHLHPWGPFSPNPNSAEQSGITPPMTPLSFQSMQSMPHAMSEQVMMYGMPFGPRSGGTRLSPTAAEFQAGGYGTPGWNLSSQVRSSLTSTSLCAS